MSYWPSYGSIPPSCRSAYLSWLEGGRSDPDAYIGYVFLFFYGLERRALADTETLASASEELPQIHGEVERLLGIYSDNRSFRGYATAFRDVLGLLIQQSDPETYSPGYADCYELPIGIRIAAGSMALTATPLPGRLAFAWATSDPNIPLRTPARRCRSEFEALFLARYEKKHGLGLKLRTCKRKVKVQYQTASRSFSSSYEVRTEVPDVTSLVGPRRKLNELVAEVTTDLDSYSRKLGRNPDSADPLAAAAVLPPELISTHSPPEVQNLIRKLKARLEGKEAIILPATDALSFWLPSGGAKQTKKDAIASVTLLAASGIGVEPDVRFNGPKLSSNDQACIFRLEPGDPMAPTSHYAAASLLLHLAAMVAASDGEVSMEEDRHLREHVLRSLDLEPGEQRRLAAHIAWLLTNPPGLAGVKKRVETLSHHQRQSIGRFLVQVAAADGVIDPKEVTTLTKLFRVLGLDPGEVHGELHRVQADRQDADAPISVRPARKAAPGRPIPPPDHGVPSQQPEAELDMSLIQAKLVESASVSALLAGIFADQEEVPFSTSPPCDGTSDEGALDPAHRRLLQDLSSQELWSMEEFEDLAESHGLLPNGALDMLNELAWEACDQALSEGDDPLELDPSICKKLLAS